MADGDNDGDEVTRAAAALGRKGGNATKRKHGREFYVALGRLGGKKNVEKHGREFYVAIGKKGGKVTVATYGVNHFKVLGKIGGARTKALIEAALRAEVAACAAVERSVDQAAANLRKTADAVMASLTPRERGIVEKRMLELEGDGMQPYVIDGD